LLRYHFCLFAWIPIDLINKKDFYCLGFVALAITLVCLPLILVGPQEGHSIFFNLSWSAGFSEQLLGGEWYPRWILQMNLGAGSPVFFFYAPVPFYFISLGFIGCSSCPLAVQLGIGEWLIILCSGFSFYFFIRNHSIKYLAALGSIIYALSPYHFGIDVLTRQAIGEAAAYIWIPLIFLSIDRMVAGKPAVVGFSVSYALLVMTHLPLALLTSLFLPVYILIQQYYASPVGLIKKFIFGVVIGLLLSAIYLVPAMFSQEYIAADRWWVPYLQVQNWFFLDGVEAPAPGFASKLFLVLVGMSIVFIPAWAIAYRFRQNHNQGQALILGCLLLFAGGWFLMLPISAFFWDLLPFLKKVQFPWRVMVLIDFAIVITLVLAMNFSRDACSKKLFISAIGVVGVFMAMSLYLNFDLYSRLENKMDDVRWQARLKENVQASMGAVEYLPVTTALSPKGVNKLLGRIRPDVLYDPQYGEVKITKWAPRDIVLAVNFSQPTNLAIRQLYYTGWQATIDAGPVPLKPASELGLMQVTAPAGQYQLRFSLLPQWQEITGWAISGIGVLVLASILLFRNRKWGQFFDL
jgi:hypothetical protein